MQTKTAEQTTENYVHDSLQAFLEGRKNLSWFLGAMRSGGRDAIAVGRMLADLPGYGLPERRAELIAWLNSQPK